VVEHSTHNPNVGGSSAGSKTISPHQLLDGVAEVDVPVEGVLVGEGRLGHQELVGLVSRFQCRQAFLLRC
jgi:hypothetical protein